MSKKTKIQGPKVLILDIETAPIIGHIWGLFDQNIGLNQIVSDWHILSWSAKWLKDTNGRIYGPHSDVMHQNQSKVKNIENDLKLLKGIWKLIDASDIIITQNGKKFDIKKLNARFILNGLQKPSSFKHIDILILAKRHFGFTSNKLEYMTDKLCTKYKKLHHKKFLGHEMWMECLKKNKDAWKEMEIYNNHDILALEELYHIMIPWDSSINFNLYNNELTTICKCGSKEFSSKGYHYTAMGKFKRNRCKICGNETRGTVNLFSKEKKDALKRNIVNN